jgi:hypothetical protein
MAFTSFVRDLFLTDATCFLCCGSTLLSCGSRSWVYFCADQDPFIIFQLSLTLLLWCLARKNNSIHNQQPEIWYNDRTSSAFKTSVFFTSVCKTSVFKTCFQISVYKTFVWKRPFAEQGNRTTEDLSCNIELSTVPFYWCKHCRDLSGLAMANLR